MNSTSLVSELENLDELNGCAFRKCRFIIDGSFDDDERISLIEILQEMQLSALKLQIELQNQLKNQSNHG